MMMVTYPEMMRYTSPSYRTSQLQMSNSSSSALFCPTELDQLCSLQPLSPFQIMIFWVGIYCLLAQAQPQMLMAQSFSFFSCYFLAQTSQRLLSIIYSFLTYYLASKYSNMGNFLSMVWMYLFYSSLFRRETAILQMSYSSSITQHQVRQTAVCQKDLFWFTTQGCLSELMRWPAWRILTVCLWGAVGDMMPELTSIFLHIYCDRGLYLFLRLCSISASKSSGLKAIYSIFQLILAYRLKCYGIILHLVIMLSSHSVLTTPCLTFFRQFLYDLQFIGSNTDIYPFNNIFTLLLGAVTDQRMVPLGYRTACTNLLMTEMSISMSLFMIASSSLGMSVCECTWKQGRQLSSALMLLQTFLIRVSDGRSRYFQSWVFSWSQQIGLMMSLLCRCYSAEMMSCYYFQTSLSAAFRLGLAFSSKVVWFDPQISYFISAIYYQARQGQEISSLLYKSLSS